MKILIAGSNKSWALERIYIKYLKELGMDVYLYPAPDIVFDIHSRNIFNKILFKTKIKTWYKGVNAGLIEHANFIKPDIIWVFKGMEIYPSTLKFLRTKVKLANYNPDHPFIISSSGGGNKNVSESVGLYHLHFFYNNELGKQIEQAYHIPTVSLPFGYELSSEDYLIALKEPGIERVCFLGNPDKTREEIVKLVAENGFSIDVYGHGWDKSSVKNHKNVNVHDAVYGLSFWKILRTYKIQLNIFRDHNLGSHNMRSFEIPAVGGVQLAPYSEEHASFFEEGKEIFLYRDKKDLLKYLNYLMNCDDKIVSETRKAARIRSLDSFYSYKDRAAIVFDTFQRIMLNEQRR